MQVTRDVILDLAPAYLTGEASSDTRALVDAYLAGDPEMAAWMADQHRHTFAPHEDTPPLELETRTLRRTRRRIAVQRWLFGLGCFFVALSLSLEFTTRNGRVVEFHFLARDYPLQAAICVAVAVLFWSAYAALRRNRL